MISFLYFKLLCFGIIYTCLFLILNEIAKKIEMIWQKLNPGKIITLPSTQTSEPFHLGPEEGVTFSHSDHTSSDPLLPNDCAFVKSDKKILSEYIEENERRMRAEALHPLRKTVEKTLKKERAKSKKKARRMALKRKILKNKTKGKR